MFNVTVLASAGGGIFQSLIDAQGPLGYKINMLITDRFCNAMRRAMKNKIPYKAILNKDLITTIPDDTNLIVSAGYMSIISPEVCKAWAGKIINTHPSLLPKYGGKGMIGVKVQEAVMEAKEEYAGCTVHFVDEGIDRGKIIVQEKIKINYEWTPYELGGFIHDIEKQILPFVVKHLLKDRK